MAGVLGGMEVVGDGGGGVSPTDIDTLVKLNAIFVDGTTLDDDSDPRDPNAHTQAADTISDSGSKGRQVLQAVDSSGVRAAIKVSLTYSSAGAPGANNDSVDTAGVGQAFAVGDFWQRSTVPARYYRVDDVTPTAAVWQRVDPAVFATAAQGALAASALQPGDIVWTGEAIATELIASGDGDTVLTAQLTNTPSGPVICHYEGTTRVQGAGECFTISGKQITWLESVGGSGTAPPMAVGENLWFFYGSTGLALGTAAYEATTEFLHSGGSAVSSTPYVVAAGEVALYFDAGSVAVTLPTIATFGQNDLYVLNRAAAGTVTITPAGGETIGLDATLELLIIGESYILRPQGTDWGIF